MKPLSARRGHAMNFAPKNGANGKGASIVTMMTAVTTATGIATDVFL